MANNLEVHWNATKRVLWYLQGNISFGIEYTNHLNVELIGYSNSDWAWDLDDHKSTIRYALNIEPGVVSWRNKKQPTIFSLSSIEDEYKALCIATCQTIWLQTVLEDMGRKEERPTSIKYDDQRTIKLEINHIYHARSKHIETHHLVREKI